ncbi:3-hydroxylacyl-ACP dehydratase [Solimonas sp. K1W22B-7]|uniref:ApeP family dehydratase n=1 Tax=Solimonas sp. K1W22B-7 TaxID=2303331 RepID=UPI000E330DAE|nr:hotdog family protein [Solimonas sp. K1W22B-7]AXQ29288.1 3-hydroxylacyl-ACP dehydratase [Solimonas sp. K1W22B-7]
MENPADVPIGELLPHAGPMRLLDRVLAATDEYLVAEAQPRADHLFAQGTVLGSWVGVEYMAQAVAAWAGWQARQRGEPPRLGFLLGSRRYECRQPRVTLGSLLRIEVRLELRGDSGIGAFQCRIDCDGEELATANLTVFEPDDALAFLNQEQGHTS